MQANGTPGTGKLNVAIIGGGLVGSLNACFMAKRGHNVTLYEYREGKRNATLRMNLLGSLPFFGPGDEFDVDPKKERIFLEIKACPLVHPAIMITYTTFNDIRNAAIVQGKSINLAMSVRGRTSLREVGLEDVVIEKHGIPMRGRMIHALRGKNYVIPYDDVTNQCIYSVSRRYLNETLLTAAEAYPTVRTAFHHKLVSVDLQQGKMTFLKTDTQESVEELADVVIGGDGAYSGVRKQMIKQPMFDYSQTYIPHGYLELCIPPTHDNQFAMEPNYLHIWPRGTFMMIALPNQDRTWTVTLFMPFEKFSHLTGPDELLDFFDAFFPDAIPLIGKDKLVGDFFLTKASPLVSIKCKPYNVGSKSLIIGDAAHAMVPFYGQGMNAGFEDCFILNQLMDEFNEDLTKVLPEFSKRRNPDAEAICDLAMYNYIEMRDLVNKKSYLVRKMMDNVLYRALTSRWVPLYNSVAFTTMPYSQCISNRQFQDKIIDGSLMFFAAAIFAILTVLIFR